MRDLVKLLAEEHEVVVEDLLFSGNVQATINSRVCRKAWPFMVARRNHNTKKLRLESCPRSLKWCAHTQRGTHKTTHHESQTRVAQAWRSVLQEHFAPRVHRSCRCGR